MLYLYIILYMNFGQDAGRISSFDLIIGVLSKEK